VANIKSQIKRNRQNNKKRLRNRVYRGEARGAVKNARTAIDSGKPESQSALVRAISALDKAVIQGVLHKNNAARRKSRLMKAFSRMEPAKAVVEPVEMQPETATGSPKGAATKGKKAAPSAASAKGKKVVETKTTVEEPKAKPKSTSVKAKKPAVKKPAAKSSAKKK
jgi:small subunit ribosomal protein S20